VSIALIPARVYNESRSTNRQAPRLNLPIGRLTPDQLTYPEKRARRDCEG